MNENIKLDIAIETLASKIAITSKRIADSKEENKDELELLIKEREKLYSGDKQIIEKILNIYGPEIKKAYLGEV